jgi:predicted secreted protein
MSRRPLLFIAVAALVCLTPCQASDSTPRTLTADNQGQTIRIATGEKVLIRLSAQAGTGYSWQYVSKPSVKVAVQEQPRITTEAEARPGMAEDQAFQVAISAKGKYRLQFHYVRPWLRDQPARTYRVDLDVR